MANEILPTPEQLREILTYCSESGKFHWKRRPAHMFSDGNTSKEANCRAWNSRNAGREAFTSNSHGYRSAGIFGVKMLGHRVAWAIHHGRWPENEIDHINCVRDDNRIANLREATTGENKFNAPIRTTNTSGLKGVTWHKQRSKWAAQISFRGKHMSLGLHETKESAYAAYCAAAERLHAEFARFA